MSELRTEIGRAIVKAFNRTYDKHGCDFDPDTCYEAADEVIAMLASNLLDQPVEIERPVNIGPASFRTGHGDLLDQIERHELAQIEARNPGIDMDDVKRTRVAQRERQDSGL